MRLIMMLMVLGSIIVGCNTSINREEMKEYLTDPENKLFLEREINGYNTLVGLVPEDFINSSVSNELEKESEVVYFKLFISDHGTETTTRFVHNQQKYQNLQNVLDFKMDNYSYLITSDHDTIQPIQYSNSKTYGMGGATSLLFSFEINNMKKLNWIELVIEEFGLNIGIQKYRFNTLIISNIPHLISNNIK